MRITLLAAGAAGMYCGSCMRDQALAAELLRAGHDVTLVPLYSPLRTDAHPVEPTGIFYGGLNVFLQQASGLFRHTPRALDRWLDRPGLLNVLSRLAGSTDPARLGGLTVSVLSGRHGRQVKELNRLLAWLAEQGRPDVISLPNAMFVGLAEPLRRTLGAPILCELTGEDVFLEGLPEPHRGRALERVRAGARQVDLFLATSAEYAARMAEWLDLPAGRVAVAWPGVFCDDLAPLAAAPQVAPTVGFLARICPEKGLPVLLEAMESVRRRPGLQDARCLAGGYLGPGDRRWFARLGGADRPGFTYVGELDRQGKRQLLGSVDLLCVPTPRPEPKGLYVLEALAAGRPFVGFDHGGPHEWSRSTGGCRLVRPGDVEALADALAALLSAPAERVALGEAGRVAVVRDFSAEAMARRFEAIAARALAAADSTGRRFA